jgi:uncharacterized membrane protein
MQQKEITPPARHMIHSVQKKHDAMRTWSERLADTITNLFGSIIFFSINFIWFSLWMAINTGALPLVEPFDPYPFGLLTMIVSLEAIFLSIFVLLSQKRSAKIDALREEVDLQIDIITEQELTKIMHLLVKLLEKNGIDTSKDLELQEMLKQLNTSKIEKVLEQQIV